MEKERKTLTGRRRASSPLSSPKTKRIGRIHVYTGDGKGKTTAALGLLLRAVGAGLRVCLIQFAKHGCFSEIRAIRTAFPGVRVRQFGTGRFIRDAPSASDIRAARAGLKELLESSRSGRFDIVIGDEAVTAASLGLFSQHDLLSLVRARNPGVELILTGRGAGRGLIRAAHLVTEMREIKHYYRSGMPARSGIEF